MVQQPPSATAPVRETRAPASVTNTGTSNVSSIQFRTQFSIHLSEQNSEEDTCDYNRHLTNKKAETGSTWGGLSACERSVCAEGCQHTAPSDYSR
ncbi:hypothetical protein Asppvi_007092 [Aspergillus pseudoviridinutans]|uniref:Uncharacterized protein n=1 Tax=Aspergillus pseudoviridinutans TaxID=1517512 RepID=A0A9P3BDT3_9EURO|nr:uncharacterized protein Asppvi_007092 [Aspergillus pseudoviridinutans]GIJ88174.1 hypothetical protein Asppvi_007092 [Aspergillus pseudoviridinutans]